MRILLVDSEYYSQKLISEFLRYQGLDVTIASTIEQAKRLIGNKDFEIVLIEYSLPDGNGIELTQDVRKQNKEVKIVGIGYDEKERAFYNAGADLYVNKPFKYEALIRIIKNMQTHLQES